MPKNSGVSPDQQSLFGLEPSHHQSKDENKPVRAAPAKKPKRRDPLSFHRENDMVVCPVSTDDGVVWQELPETDERARIFVGLCYADRKYLKGAEWRYQSYLDTKDIKGYKPPPLNYYAIWKAKEEAGEQETEVFLF